MTVIHRHADTTATPTTENTQTPTTVGRRALALLRIGFGLTFLWAFFDKLLALGFHTGYDQDGNLDRFGDAAWINGGSPTEGFLKFGADGPFKGFYNSIGGTFWADWLFMLGLLGIGLALTLGIGMRRRGRRRRRPLRDDVDRRPAPGEQPRARRPHPRRHQHGRPRRLLRRRHVGPRQAPGPRPSSSTTTPSSGSPPPGATRPPDLGPGAVCCRLAPRPAVNAWHGSPLPEPCLDFTAARTSPASRHQPRQVHSATSGMSSRCSTMYVACSASRSSHSRCSRSQPSDAARGPAQHLLGQVVAGHPVEHDHVERAWWWCPAR